MHLPNSDRPLSNPDDDKYGFVELSSRLAGPIVHATTGEGLVVGIEGQWGVGKTTLLEFLDHTLRHAKIEGLRTITLAPWLQGDRVGLSTELLAKLGEALDAENKETQKKAKQKEFKETIGRYAILAGRGSVSVLEVAGDLLPGGSMAKRATKLATDALESVIGGGTILELKAAIRNRIAESGLRFVVVIDDLDRLEPSQAAEVVRVVRSVADFPRVVYVLSYDRDVLAHALEQSLGVKDGARYLQKVVQLSLPMPAFEPFDLRVQLREELLSLYGEFEGASPNKVIQEDLERAIDSAGAFLNTPREVTLVTNAVRFAWHASRLDTYYPDVCRVQIYKIVRRDLYDWLEGYLGVRSILVTNAGRLSTAERARFGMKLYEVLPDDDTSSNSIYTLSGIVPGLSRDENAEKRVFGGSYAREVNTMIDRKRLGSPIHSRAYFAFAIPKTVMSDRDWNAFLQAAGSDRNELERLILYYAETQRPVGGSWLRHVLDRMDESAIERMNSAQLKGVLLAFANVMDDILRLGRPWIPFLGSDEQRAASIAWAILRRLRSVDPEGVGVVLSEALEDGRAVNWLVGEFIRTEIFARGEAGDGGHSSNDPALANDEIDHARSTLGIRIEEVASDGKILDLPKPSRFLWGWRALKGEEAVRTWVAAIIQDDLAFVSLLSELRGAVFSDREYRVLKEDNVSAFMNFEEAAERIRALVSMEDTAISMQAREVQDAIELACSF